MLIHEDYIRCSKCGHNRFIEEREVVISREPYEQYHDIVLSREFLSYKCAKCKEILMNKTNQLF